MSVPRLGIAGVGLIGGSIGLRARGLHMHVIGFDRDPATVARALARGAIDASAADLDALAGACETLVIALPVDATAVALDHLAGTQGPELVIDVASVKATLVAPGAGVGNYVGTHPMAGREQGGIDAAEAGLFEGATWAYVPRDNPLLIEKTRALIIAMGARPLEIDPVRHDAVVALTSHLPQLLSVLLGAELGSAASADGSVTELCGPGILSMLRLARSPQTTWAPIVAANAPAIARRLRSIGKTIEAAAMSLEAGESAALMSYFEGAHEAVVALEERFPPGSRS